MIDSIIEMAPTNKLSYTRLRNEGGPVDDDDHEHQEEEEKAQEERLSWRVRRWSRIRRVNGKKRRRVRIPGLRRFLRKKDKLISAVRVSWGKVFRRLMENRYHMGDLFAGNYLFVQVTPSPIKSANKPSMALGLHNITSKSSLGKVSY